MLQYTPTLLPFVSQQSPSQLIQRSTLEYLPRIQHGVAISPRIITINIINTINTNITTAGVAAAVVLVIRVMDRIIVIMILMMMNRIMVMRVVINTVLIWVESGLFGESVGGRRTSSIAGIWSGIYWNRCSPFLLYICIYIRKNIESERSIYKYIYLDVWFYLPSRVFAG